MPQGELVQRTFKWYSTSIDDPAVIIIVNLISYVVGTGQVSNSTNFALVPKAWSRSESSQSNEGRPLYDSAAELLSTPPTMPISFTTQSLPFRYWQWKALLWNAGVCIRVCIYIFLVATLFFFRRSVWAVAICFVCRFSCFQRRYSF